MNKILDEILFSDSEFSATQDRLIAILKEAISSSVLSPYPDFTETITEKACQLRIKKHKKSDRKFKKTTLKENERDQHNPLPIKKNTQIEAELILPNRKTRADSFLSDLAKKYVKKIPEDLNQDPLSDEQFHEIQEKFQKKQKRNKIK